MVTGNPVPEVARTQKGQPLPKSDKYEYQYDANSGQVVLVIRDLGSESYISYPLLLKFFWKRLMETLLEKIKGDKSQKPLFCL